MSSADTQPKSSEARRLLRSAADPVAYDLEAGLRRHQRLVAEGSTLPDWANEPLPGRSFRRIGVLGGLAVLMVGLGYLLGRPATPASSVPVVTLRPAVSASQSAPAAPVSLAPAPLTAQPPELAPLVEQIGQLTPRPAPEPARQLPAASAGVRARPLAEESPRAQVAAPRTPPRARAQVVDPSLDERPAKTQAEASAPAVDVVAQLAAGETASLGARAADIVGGAPAEAMLPGQPASASEPPELTPEQPEVLAEMEQLRQAEQLLPVKPERTLALVRAGFQRFRPGYLNQERRYLEVMALLGMGKVEDARLLGKLFLRDYPSGPYRRKVESALAR